MRTKIRFDVNETVYLPFKINEICVNNQGKVTYTIVGSAPFMIYSQTGIDQNNLQCYGVSFDKKEETE